VDSADPARHLFRASIDGWKSLVYLIDNISPGPADPVSCEPEPPGALLPHNGRSVVCAGRIQSEQRLTLKLGLRHEMTDGWNEAHGHNSNYIFDANGIIQTDPRIGTSAFLENHSKLLLQPRVGLAWDPTGTGRWAVRAGFGMHNDLQDNLAHRVNADPPYNPRISLVATPIWTIMQNPIRFGQPLPPTCNAQSPLRWPDCSVYFPGGLDPVMRTPTIQQWSLTVERGYYERSDAAGQLCRQRVLPHSDGHG